MEGNEVCIRYYEDIPTYDFFLQNHLLPNIPALIGPALTKNWKARHEWVTKKENSNNNDNKNQPEWEPRLDYLNEQFGKAMVNVADCIERDFTDQKRSDMTFEEFIKLWPDGRYYLKDWHFVRAYPEYQAYEVPHIFADDWMNEYWLQENKDDYRFVYMGGDGTFTPLHSDVYKSYSWSSNICGIKRWVFIPPGDEKYLKDRFGNLVYDLRNYDHQQFPNVEKARKLIYYQRDGTTIFVPSGWHHQVDNIGMTISINHNWSNACNLGLTFRSLTSDLYDVERSIDDLRQSMPPMEFVQTCQQLLLAHSGWDWCIFVKMLNCISQRLSKQIKSPDHDEAEQQPPLFSLSLQPKVEWQAQQILIVLEEWKHKSAFLNEYLKQEGLDDLIQNIERSLLPLLKSK
ncbi:hypothetical protein BDA99DRAFT_485790 [Phascolomyces articulosus]|uniref:JmjC domain-containing protein n=1 Tax=Phascolomyces articulosus TaxID=60185 RepID=A0AAD5K3N5_9FUNG|nr:hypothetical protein BDA99DRAFT_485790 [Phascolomyces articulosus]